MRTKIFWNSMLVGLAVFLLSVGLFMGVLYQHLCGQLTRELETEACLVARGVETMGLDYLEGLSAANRITWVDGDGTVLYDSVADQSAMENHGSREEIREALEGNTGVAVRRSGTLAKTTVYAALALRDGTVIRLAGFQDNILLVLASMLPSLAVILLLALVLAAVLAGRLTRRIVRPILELDLEHPESCAAYEELAPLLTRIRRQNDTIRGQMDLLRQRQTEFAALTENMSEGFVLLDRKGNILSLNSGAMRLLETKKPEEGDDVLTLEGSGAFRQTVERALSGFRCQGRLEGVGRCVQVIANPVLREGQVEGAVLVLMEVTDREQGEKLRREFTANVSHELKTPLTAISGMAEILKNGLVRPEDVTGFAGDIYKESQRLIALVEDIIHLSRLDEGGPGLGREQVDLMEVARRVAQRLKPLASQAGISFSLSGGAATVLGVPAVLEEMVYNLCDNAVKYNRPGGRVAVEVIAGEECVQITVADTGIGIPAREQERVFERFYRVDKSHSKEIGGTGLGLSIVKHGAVLHDARVELNSVLNQGTTVRLLFPT